MKEVLNDKVHLKNHSKKPLLKVIREKCLDCCVDQPSEVRKCHITACSLWPYRMGENPFRKHKLTNEQIQAAVERLK